MKKFLSFLIVFVLVVSMMVPFAINIGASAASGTTGDCTWSLDDAGVLTISGNGTMGDYTDCGPWGTSITEVIIEDGVTSIGDSAFYNCNDLKYLTIGDNVTTIGDHAFYDCDSLYSVDIPGSVTTIGDYAFVTTTAYLHIKVPYTVVNIGESAFCPEMDGKIYLDVHEDSVAYTYAVNHYQKYMLTYDTEEHTDPNATVVPATCIAAGSESGVCEICGMEYSYEIPKLEHTPIGEVTVIPATCTSDGSSSGHCSTCDQAYSVTLPMTDHIFEEGICTTCGLPDLQSGHLNLIGQKSRRFGFILYRVPPPSVSPFLKILLLPVL